MSGWQVEDNLWAECYRAASGRPIKTDFYKKHQNPRAAEHRGGSGNFWWMACGVASKIGEPDPIKNVREGTDQPHDYDLNEPYVDDEHARFILAGKTLARDGFAFGPSRDESLASRLSIELRQFWASLLLCSTSPGDLSRNFIVRPGARASGMKTARDRMEYLLLRADGWTEEQIRKGVIDGKKIVKRANRVDLNQEYSTAQMFEALKGSFQADFRAVYTAFLKDGWAAIAQCFQIGTRAPFEWCRFQDGSMALVMEKNCNANNGPRWAVRWKPGDKVPEQFPKKAVKRMQFEQGEAIIDLDRRVIEASAEHSGSWVKPLPLVPMVLHLRSDKFGCRILRDLPGQQPPEVAPPPVDDEPETKPWWKFW